MRPSWVLLDYLVGHAGLVVILALDMADRDDLHKVAVARGILGQEDEMVVCPMVGVLELMVVVPRDVHLAADDGLDLVATVFVLVLSGHLEELLHAVHITVVRDGDRGHIQLYGALEKLPHIGESVEDGVLGVDVKMDEGHRLGFE